MNRVTIYATVLLTIYFPCNLTNKLQNFLGKTWATQDQYEFPWANCRVKCFEDYIPRHKGKKIFFHVKSINFSF